MMSMKKFAAVVREAVDSLPEEIKRHLENVVIDVEEEPSVDFLLDAGFTDAADGAPRAVAVSSRAKAAAPQTGPSARSPSSSSTNAPGPTTASARSRTAWYKSERPQLSGERAGPSPAASTPLKSVEPW